MNQEFSKQAMDLANIEHIKCRCGEYFIRLKNDELRTECPKCFIKTQQAK